MENLVLGCARQSLLGVPLIVAVALAGCAATRPSPYALSAGAIGVAVVAPPSADLAAQDSLAGRGFAVGLMSPLPLANAGPVGLAVGILAAPFTALYGAARGAACEQELQKAYPGLAEKYAAIVQREFSPEDMRAQFVAALQEQTTAPIVPVELPPGRSAPDSNQELLAVAARQALSYLFVVTVKGIGIGSDLGAKECTSWTLNIELKTELWSVAEPRFVLYAYPRNPHLTGPFPELGAVFDQPGALRERLAPEFRADATYMLDFRRLQLPP